MDDMIAFWLAAIGILFILAALTDNIGMRRK